MIQREVAVYAPDFQAIKLLGCGVQSNVVLVKPKNASGPKRVLKVPLNPFHEDAIAREADILSKLSHPHILAFESFCSSGNLGLFEFCQNGDMLDRLLSAKRFPEHIARYFFIQLIDALEFLHSSGFVHRDVKLENLMLGSNFEIKLIDFGFATKIIKDSKLALLGFDDFFQEEEPKKSSEVLGTDGYQPPEMLNLAQYDPRHHDFFAAGVTLFALVVGSFPFEEAKIGNKFYKHLATNQFDTYWKMFPTVEVSDEFKDFVQGLLSFEERNRLSCAKKIKKHPWYKGNVATDEEVTAFLKGN